MRRIRIATLLVLVAALVVGTANVALANTEMVPGSRVVFPYIDISSGRETFLLLTNTGTSTVALHLEFYSQQCNRQDIPVELTKKDLAVVVVSKVPSINTGFLAPVAGDPKTTKQQNIAGLGFVDIDVRQDCGGNLRGCASIEYNGIMGNAVVVDVSRDFAFAYPAAASQGSAGGPLGGPLGTIVKRNPVGLATDWEGAYETYPSNIFIPAYFAETACLPSAALSAYLAIAAPADAWRKEGPGEDLGIGTLLLDTQVNIFDGAENSTSDDARAHFINGELCNVYDATALRSQYDITPPIDSSGFAYAGADVTFGQINTVGWLEIFNSAETRFGVSSPSGLPANVNFSTTNGFDDSRRGRGMVAILFEIQDETLSIGTPPVVGAVHIGDVIRSWADPATQIDWPCFGTEGAGGIAPPTTLPGTFNNPTCNDELGPPFNAVNPSWIGDHAQTEGGRQR